ncbi:hypothetical protein OSTOST_16883 [Ostertagia ostertagi]
MALAFVTLAQSFNTDDHPGRQLVQEGYRDGNRTVFFLETGQVLNLVWVPLLQVVTLKLIVWWNDDFEMHSRNDMEPVAESLYSFKGTIQTAPDILHVHKQAIQKYRENECKLSHADAERIKRRVDSTSYAVLAEMNHLNTEKVGI